MGEALIFSFQVEGLFYSEQAAGFGDGLSKGLEEVVPVVMGWAEALDGRVSSDHALGHGVSGGVGVEAAEDRNTSEDETGQPTGIGTSAGGRPAK
jgi:hypothetical protein